MKFKTIGLVKVYEKTEKPYEYQGKTGVNYSLICSSNGEVETFKCSEQVFNDVVLLGDNLLQFESDSKWKSIAVVGILEKKALEMMLEKMPKEPVREQPKEQGK